MDTREALALRKSQVDLICSSDGCAAKSHSRGFCGRHYAQWRRGASDAEKARPAADERFWEKVDKASETGCWAWTGAVSPQGYGTFWDGEKFIGAHRYVLARGGAELGDLVVDHTCHNDSGCVEAPCSHRRCVNPSHLEAVDQATNSRRGRTGEHMRKAA